MPTTPSGCGSRNARPGMSSSGVGTREASDDSPWRLEPGAVHVTTAKAYHPGTFGQPPAPAVLTPPATTASNGSTLRGLFGRARQAIGASADAAPQADPAMQMNPYNLSELGFLLQSAGIRRFHADFTDHGGELGVFLFFQKPAAVAKPA